MRLRPGPWGRRWRRLGCWLYGHDWERLPDVQPFAWSEMVVWRQPWRCRRCATLIWR